MSKEYFNIDLFNSARANVIINPYDSRKKLEAYIETYPEDYLAKSYYASLFITLGEFDEAERLIEEIEENFAVGKEKILGSRLKRISLIEENLIFSKVRLLAYQKKYDELYSKYFGADSTLPIDVDSNMNDEQISYFNYCMLLFYVQKQLGLVSEITDPGIDTYVFNQILNYDENRFRVHLRRHISGYNGTLSKGIKTPIFRFDFPIDKVIDEIKKLIPSDKGLYFGLIDDTYFFRYDDCGSEDGKRSNFFRVICLHDTCEFITMYPIAESNCTPYTDLNYLRDTEVNNSKVRKMSNVEKFKKRYGIE